MAKPALRPRFLAPGDKLGKFDLIRQIAVGGMAELYLARTMGIEGFEKLVVVKRILPQFAENQSFVTMFLNEARLSATLHHPNITQVYDIGVEDRDYFFSMEYVHGEDLGRLMATGAENGVPVSLDAALTLIAGLCAGLHYAHEKAGPDGTPLAVVHRDVSPSNVLVSYDGAVKLVDFGIARAGSAPATRGGALKGKISYMSPEQCRGNAALDRRSDVFSAGTILYELTTGRLPFDDETEYAVLNQIVNTDAPRPTSIVADYPPALEAIVLKALARNVDDRYPTALALQGAIEDFAHENRLRVSPLVLARLMSMVFPARLEEWDHARAQGAFFVEQHVVRTLIESGKAPDLSVVTGVLPGTVSGVVQGPADDEETAVTSVHVAASIEDETLSGPPPVALTPSPVPGTITPLRVLERAAAPRASTPSPVRASTPPPVRASTPPPVRAATPPPERAATPPPVRASTPPPVRASTPPPVRAVTPPARMPEGAALGATPAMPGSLQSSGTHPAPARATPVEDHAAPLMMSASIDVTERVRVPAPSPRRDATAYVRPRSRLPLLIGIVLAAGVAVAAILSLGGGGDAPERKATPTERPDVGSPSTTRTEPSATEPTVTEPSAIVPSVTEPTAIEPSVTEPTVTEPSVTEPSVTEPSVIEPTAIKPTSPVVKQPAAKPVVKRPVKKPAAKPASRPVVKKPEPRKDPTWNDDSPFMPVRTDKR